MFSNILIGIKIEVCVKMYHISYILYVIMSLLLCHQIFRRYLPICIPVLDGNLLMNLCWCYGYVLVYGCVMILPFVQATHFPHKGRPG
jgi:hypothetical protein